MKKSEVYHVVYESDLSAWKVEKEGSPRPITRTGVKDAAIRTAKSLARSAAHGRVVVHRKDGRVQEDLIYGKDPAMGFG